eukprot:10613430-Lingulodinium_polyedra.AAC.1
MRECPEDALEMSRMIKRGQVKVLRGCVVEPDKPLNSNFNKVCKATVGFMREFLIEGTEGQLTRALVMQM